MQHLPIGFPYVLRYLVILLDLLVFDSQQILTQFLDWFDVFLTHLFGLGLDYVLKARIRAHTKDGLLPFAERLPFSSLKDHSNQLFVTVDSRIPVFFLSSFLNFSWSTSQLINPLLNLIFNLLTLLVADCSILNFYRGMELEFFSNADLVVFVKEESSLSILAHALVIFNHTDVRAILKLKLSAGASVNSKVRDNLQGRLDLFRLRMNSDLAGFLLQNELRFSLW